MNVEFFVYGLIFGVLVHILIELVKKKKEE